jgi:hypothetical protein
MSTVDGSVKFGMQNFFLVAVSTADGTYDYYGFQSKLGTTLIMRADKAFENILYYSSKETFASVWSGRTGYYYVLPNQL